ncbi:hypothetical protein EU805_13560 [Salipiger sp. IMCC34102]|uniref:hypothetical protein n=1 Tax=Salipiger sp. IMCC34102 TaxID=2510647 RepID=UPI00101C771A|nr:hypothetical protein [Salipiger sp. IMCC34102]RYH01677.1 hypothetical protein EU805_13560 [Salipiger sp. IMCC34102]
MPEPDPETQVRPSGKTVLGKAFLTALIAPVLGPAILAFLALGRLVITGELLQLSTIDPLAVFMWLVALPGGAYLIGFLPALATGAILAWWLPRIQGMIWRVALALVVGAVTPIPIGLMWNKPPPLPSPVPAFMMFGAFAAVATLPILHRKGDPSAARR